MPRKLVLIVPSYHMDIVWRRPPEEQVALREQQLEAALDMLAKRPEFCFALQPYEGDPFSSRVYRLGQSLNAPPLTSSAVQGEPEEVDLAAV
jgi:hypothetical protein